MSEAEDIRAVVGNHDFQNIIEAESGRSSSVDYLDTYEDVPREAAREYTEEDKVELFGEEKLKETFVENEIKPIETEKKEATQPASNNAVDVDGVAGREESSARLGSTPGSVADGRKNENAAVGEWNSLPLLVERLRAALELSLGGRRDDQTQPQTQPQPQPQPQPPPLLEDSGIDTEEDFRLRTSMEQGLPLADSCKEADLKRDLKFLEDLLLSDIQTALSKLRETLERIDVAALAKHGAASDPGSKLQLLRLVSSLLSRLQVPEEPAEKAPSMLPSAPVARRRRGTRHTIGVSAEELAKARKWLEEERNNAHSVQDQVAPILKERREQKQTTNNHCPNPVASDRKPEEIRDKCVKDAINQRQLLEDKNKEIRESCAFHRGVAQLTDLPIEEKVDEESSEYQTPLRRDVSYQSQEKSVVETEERSRVSKLAAALKQRAELASAVGKYNTGNKFSAKKSKIKRANTIDIPSYLKLQAESLGHESTGCVSLRKPINVGDKSFNPVSSIVPSFQPKTENDRKFLALISKNHETTTVAPAVPFKTFSQVKTMDMSALTNENWNSRFSNIKTTFDKASVLGEEREDKSSLKARANKMFPGTAEAQIHPETPGHVSQATGARMDTGTGFRHAPSSPFRKIEKSTPGGSSPSKVPATYHWPKSSAPSSTLKEKARQMFDRENAGQPCSKSWRGEPEKPSFPRPPWIEHERNENRATVTVTENGKLDYRSFCKQFAPFVGKASASSSSSSSSAAAAGMEPFTKPEDRRRIPGVVDGKISLKMLPDNRVQAHRYPPTESRESRIQPVPSVKERGVHGYGAHSLADATLRGSSSVAVQTGLDEDHQDEERSFRVAARISRGPDLLCSNAAVQTVDQDAVIGETESSKQWRPLYDGRDDSETNPAVEDRRSIVLDHNQNYHAVQPDSVFAAIPVASMGTRQSLGSSSGEPGALQSSQDYRRQAEKLPDTQDYSASYVSPVSSSYKEPGEASNSVGEEKASDWPIEASSFVDDENIQNQDISPEVGVVTRYTCAIATVASSVDSPEPRSEEVAMDSRASSSPSPSQWSWSKSRPPTSETVTSEDEIRRHNLLQQSLVRRLQNEITSLNDQPARYQSSSYGQYLTVEQSRPRSSTQSPSFGYQQQTSGQPPSIVSSHQQQSYTSQTAPIASSHQQQAYGQPASSSPISSHQSYSRQETQSQAKPRQVASTVHQPFQRTYDQPANFDQPSNAQGSSRFGKFLTPTPQKKAEPPRTHSPVPVPANRVGTLREAYEHPSNAQTSSTIRKERSPVPNGVTPNDSSDEYLVSCATKPSRSIVLSKSESWHQLALSNSYPKTSKVNAPTMAAARGPSHPKPPKPRSPSSQKLRSKQFEASSMADSVKKMEDKIRQYFDQPPAEHSSTETKDSARHRRSPRFAAKGMVGLSRSRTMPGLSDEKLRLVIPAREPVPLLNVNTADVDKVFDDLFEEATRTVEHQ